MNKTSLKIATALLSVIFVLSVFPNVRVNAEATIVGSGDCGGSVTWTLDSDGLLTITGTGKMADYSTTTGGYSPFFNKRFDIKKVVIENGVTEIGSYAFMGCGLIESVTIPDSVTRIGVSSFMNCDSLQSITFPQSINTIDSYAFETCRNLKSITFPNKDSITIRNDPFFGCYSVESLVVNKEFYNKEIYRYNLISNLDSVDVNFYYNVKFVNEDGTVLQSGSQVGAPVYNGSTPVKSTDSQHYTFSGWNDGTTAYSPDALPVLTDDTTFTAQYTANKYTVTFNNYDGTELSSTQYEYGTKAEAVAIPSTTPSRDADEKFTYTFIGWDNEIADVTGDVVYTAQYSTTTNQYTVTFKNYDDKVLSSAAYDYDTKAEDIKVPTPSRVADTQYTYTFTGWDKEIADVTGDATYTAQYSSTVNKYTVKFVDDEGNVLQSSDVAYGTAPEFNGATPSKADTDKATYTFSGWTDGTNTYGTTDKIPTVTGAVTYKAVFTETLKQTNDSTETEQSDNQATEPAQPANAGTETDKPADSSTETDKPADNTHDNAPVTYTIGEVKGDGINSDIVIDVHRSEDDANCISYFRSVANNGVAMKNGEQYTAVTGSTIITIKSDYIKTLPAGEYTITVNFKDGSISTTITIPERSGTSVPSTGESISPAIYVGVALILVSCAATGIILTKKRREEV